MNVVEPIKSKETIRRIEEILGRKERDLLLFVLGINTGLRISDLLALNIEDVKDRDFVDLVEQKTGKRKRFPLNNKIKALIRSYVSNKPDDDPLFSTIFKNRMERTYVYKMLKKACQKLGLEENIGTHTLRKTFGYHHYHQFRDIVLLQKIFNHYSPSVTLRYIGIDQEEIDNSYINFVL